MDRTNGFVIPGVSDITFSVDGIKYQLFKLDANKAQGPDNISPYILKYCTIEINCTPNYFYSIAAEYEYIII